MVSTASTSVSKTESLGSNPSAPAKPRLLDREAWRWFGMTGEAPTAGFTRRCAYGQVSAGLETLFERGLQPCFSD